MRRPCSFVRFRGQPGSAGAPAALGLDLAARLPVASVLMASRSVIVVFILESEFELFFLNLFTGDALRHCRGLSFVRLESGECEKKIDTNFCGVVCLATPF